MVITELGFELARASICDYDGKLLYDELFRPANAVKNYNTQYSGITEELLSTTDKTIEKDLHPKLLELVTT